MSADQDIAVIFDLDGTLVHTSTFEDRLYEQSAKEVLGDVPIDTTWESYRHVTDAGIIREIAERHGLDDVDGSIAAIRTSFGKRVGQYLAGGGACPAIVGAKAALDALRDSGYRVGIATGGWGHTARMKLEAAGIPLEGLALATSDDFHERAEIMRMCLQQLGGDSGGAVYVGDGPWDLTASRALGWAFVGIGARLEGKCDTWIADFLDPAWQQALRDHHTALGSR